MDPGLRRGGLRKKCCEIQKQHLPRRGYPETIINILKQLYFLVTKLHQEQR
jgi:hypothetical protein